VLGEVRSGIYQEREPIGFTEFAERWLEVHSSNVKASTLVSYRGAVRNHLAPYFGDQLLTMIAREHIERYLAEKIALKEEDGSPVWAAKTIHNTFTALRRRISGSVSDGGDGSGGSEVAGIAVGEHPAIGANQPVAGSVRGGGDADDRLGGGQP